MKKKRSLTQLGETEMEVLHIVWDLQQATVSDVQERILIDRKIAYTTVMTVMKNLAEKGYLRYTKDGATYVYTAARTAEEVQHSLLKSVLHKVFNDSPTALVQSLVQREVLSDHEREEILQLIENLEVRDDDHR